MHEMHVIKDLHQDILTKAQEHGVSRVTRVYLKMGEFTEINEEILRYFFESNSAGTALEGAAPEPLFVALLLYLSGLMDTFSITLSRWAANGVGYLAYAFATAAAIDLVFVVLIFVFEQGLGLLGFGRIQYHS